MEYCVTLDVFHGPLDLLLYLVKREEVDILDIPIAKIAQQFQEYLQVVSFVDVDQAGEFLLMAATLMEIKSRMLLPRDQTAKEEEVDPRLELVKQLIEYRKYKEYARILEQRAEERAKVFPRTDPLRHTYSKTPTLRPAELWDLVAAFARLMRETQMLAPRTIVMDETPIHVYQAQIRQRLAAQPRASLRELFSPPYSRGRLLGLFLAMLELIKAREIVVEQEVPFGTIWLSRLDPSNPAAAPVATATEPPAAPPVGEADAGSTPTEPPAAPPVGEADASSTPTEPPAAPPVGEEEAA